MLKSSRCSSKGRKPLSDVSNCEIFSRSCKKEAEKEAGVGIQDRLLLARSDLKILVNEIDELLVQASENKSGKEDQTQEIEAFIRLLSDMRSSLKSYVPRLKHSLKSQPLECKKSTDEPQLDLIVSSSPLVSWRNGACTIESGRQLFLLTPLHKLHPAVPKWKKPKSCEVKEKTRPKSTLKSNLKSMVKSTLESSSPVKISPLKTCSLLGSASVSIRRKSKVVIDQSGAHRVGTKSLQIDNENVSSGSRPSSSEGETEITKTLSSKYPELFGLQLEHKPMLRKEVDETLDWFLSPPKTCVLLEPVDDKMALLSSVKPEMRGSKRGELEAATPAWEVGRSTVKGKKAGETTLKRELWTKFEAVSTKALLYDRSVFQQIPRNRFLDMLEEVS